MKYIRKIDSNPNGLDSNSNLVIAIYVSVLYEASALVHSSDKKCLPFIGKSF